MVAVIYTANFGHYDDLHEPPEQDEPCEFICFTDRRAPSRVGKWRIIRIRRDRRLHPRVQAKRFKLLSHEVFVDGQLATRYGVWNPSDRIDLSIWIDGNRHIKSSTFLSDMRRQMGDGDWAVFVHPDRDCIYEEAAICASLRKCRNLPVLAQVESYQDIVPPHGGLYCNTIVVRREPSMARLQCVYESWWREILKWTNRDQLSLTYVLRQTEGCDPVIIPEHVRHNDWFNTVPHRKNT